MNNNIGEEDKESGEMSSVESNIMFEEEEELSDIENMSVAELEQCLNIDNCSESGDESANNTDMESANESRSIGEELGTEIESDDEEEKV